MILKGRGYFRVFGVGGALGGTPKKPKFLGGGRPQKFSIFWGGAPLRPPRPPNKITPEHTMGGHYSAHGKCISEVLHFILP